jgi:amidophosphoribosyltransferase
VEDVRYRCGAALAARDNVQVDAVAGIPDSGTSHALGYANAAGVPHTRPFVKYTPTWPRSFMPQDQSVRNLVARMKLIPINELIEGKRLLFCEDSIVRGTQLRETIQRIFEYGAREVHMRPACPPLLFSCRFLNFSQSKSELDLAGRQAVQALGGGDSRLVKFADPDSAEYAGMVDWIRKRLGLTSLRYQRLEDMVAAIGLPKQRVCTYCWDSQG